MSMFDIHVDAVDIKAFALDNGACIISSEHSFCEFSWGQAIKAVPVKQVSFHRVLMNGFAEDRHDEPVTAIGLATEIGIIDIRAERLVILNPGVLTVKGDGKEFSLQAESASAWIAMQAAMHVFEDREIVSDLLYPSETGTSESEESENDDENPWF